MRSVLERKGNAERKCTRLDDKYTGLGVNVMARADTRAPQYRQGSDTCQRTRSTVPRPWSTELQLADLGPTEFAQWSPSLSPLLDQWTLPGAFQVPKRSCSVLRCQSSAPFQLGWAACARLARRSLSQRAWAYVGQWNETDTKSFEAVFWRRYARHSQEH